MTNQEDYQVVQYIEIARREMHRPDDWLPTRADVDHSALLRRIRSGKPLFKVPPPRSYSYPWYQLIDDGCHYFAQDAELQYNERGNKRAFSNFEIYRHQIDGERVVSINQDRRWRDVTGGYLTYTGRDRWIIEAVDESENHFSGITSVYEGRVPANRVLKRIDREDVW